MNDGIASGKKIVWSDLYNDTVTNVAMITATSALVRDLKKNRSRNNRHRTCRLDGLH